MNKLLKENAKNFIVEQSLELFMKSSIANVTISDIAKHVGVGEATLYRYFQKKQNIVIQASAKLAETVFNEYFEEKSNLSGFEQISVFYNTYLKIFKNNPSYFRFIDELDTYLYTETDIQKGEYESEIDVFKTAFIASFEKGVQDGSVKDMENKEIFYYSTTHSLLNLCKFLATASNIQQDKFIHKEEEIKVLIDIVLQSIRG